MQNAANAYASVAKAGLSGRDLEASLLIRAAAQLQAVVDDWEVRQDQLDEALTYNRRLWSILATAATDESNPLPQKVKEDFSLLAVFVFKRTTDLLVEPQSEKVGSLININLNIAAGLREPARAA
ncbi:MAG: flagellar biosynthesis regulator FlaF [Alsobacter sp.]